MEQNYRIHTKETTVRVLNTQVSAVRKKDIVKKAVRVLEDGKIGIAGSIGNRPDNELLEEARANLQINIPYPEPPEDIREEHVVLKNNQVNHENVLEQLEDILSFLREEYPEFDFSEVAKVLEVEVNFTDSNGKDLKYVDQVLELGLLMKEKALANLFDGFIGYQGRNFDKDTFIERSREILDAYKVEVPLPEETELPVMILDDSIFHGKLTMELSGERYGAGSSLFANKIGEKLFNDKIEVYQNYNPKTAFRPFFDKEGVVNEGYEYPLIKNGVLTGVFTNSKVAKDYGLPLTGSASGAYDDVPSVGATKLAVKIDSEDLENTVEKAIMIVIAAGGDYTPDGSYATPVQKAFLYEKGKIVGKLPEFQLKSHLYDMLGKDYIGTFKANIYTEDYPQVTVAKMKIVR